MTPAAMSSLRQPPPNPSRERVWDLHCHLQGLPGATPQAKMARLVEFADRVGVERLCVFMGYPMTQNPTPARLREENDQVLQALEHHHDRAFGFAYVSPEHPEASVREIDRCIRDGPMVGIKLWVAKKCSDPAIDPIIRRAAELQAVIFQHTWIKTGGELPGESTPYDLIELAGRHPDVPLICGHTGGNWELGIRIVRSHPRIHIDMAGSDPTSGMAEMAVRELGAERVLYGSDVAGRSFASQLAKIRSARVPDAAKRLILGGNLRRLLHPILKAKGVRVDDADN